jgi:hypothetical protein
MKRLAAAGSLLLAAFISTTSVQAFDDAKYPDWKGRWDLMRVAGVGAPLNPGFDTTKPWGLGQQAPLTPEYQKVLEASMADQAKGGLGNYPPAQCMPSGMPRMMTFGAHEYVITPATTYIVLEWDRDRRVFTDGRDWPSDLEPTYAGYSIGRWIDTDGDGRYDVLAVETRGPFKGPRAYEASGLPLHFDNESIFLERFYLDKSNANILHDEMTIVDHALTRPWTVDRRYVRSSDPRPNWPENYCTESNANVVIDKENYRLSADGLLMPAKKDQAPPDLRYFKRTHE